MYLNWGERKIKHADTAQIEQAYEEGYLATRLGADIFQKTRSLRICLKDYLPTSENRRILKKTEQLILTKKSLPYEKYNWSIGKLGKDFYEKKFGEKIFSANKIKEILTGKDSSPFNTLLTYSTHDQTVGYAISLTTQNIFHYAYPFYDLDATIPNIGLGMMQKAILSAQESEQKFFYLGSFQRITDTYKLQFNALEWFDGKMWQTDLEQLKNQLTSK